MITLNFESAFDAEFGSWQFNRKKGYFVQNDRDPIERHLPLIAVRMIKLRGCYEDSTGIGLHRLQTIYSNIRIHFHPATAICADMPYSWTSGIPVGSGVPAEPLWIWYVQIFKSLSKFGIVESGWLQLMICTSTRARSELWRWSVITSQASRDARERAVTGMKADNHLSWTRDGAMSGPTRTNQTQNSQTSWSLVCALSCSELVVSCLRFYSSPDCAKGHECIFCWSYYFVLFYYVSPSSFT